MPARGSSTNPASAAPTPAPSVLASQTRPTHRLTAPSAGASARTASGGAAPKQTETGQTMPAATRS